MTALTERQLEEFCSTQSLDFTSFRDSFSMQVRVHVQVLIHHLNLLKDATYACIVQDMRIMVRVNVV
jgi:hypothetical protein